MRIIINVASIFKGGAEQVANSFINECKTFDEHDYHVFLCSNIADQLDLDTFPGNFHFYHLDKRPGSSLLQLVKTLRYFNRLEKEIQPDVVISTGGHGYWKPKKAPLIAGFNIPHFIYPESPYFSRIGLRGRLRWYLKKKVHMYFYGRVNAIIGQTDDVKNRVSDQLPGRQVYTISNTINGCFYEPISFPNKLPQKQKGEFRLLTVSSFYPHKNLDVINDVVSELKSVGFRNVKFVLTLPESAFEQCIAHENRDMVYNVKPIPIKECPSLYNECDAMFLPTLLECFSASYAEAMAMEKPILTSDLGFARTVCGDASLYFDPVNPKDIASKILKVYENNDLRNLLVKKGKLKLQQLNTPSERAKEFISIGEKLRTNERTAV